MCETSFQMTEELAREIKGLRLGTPERPYQCTWRRLCEIFADNHPELEITRGHQIEGMEICREAGKVLGERGIDW
jgi:hypothetical protein